MKISFNKELIVIGLLLSLIFVHRVSLLLIYNPYITSVNKKVDQSIIEISAELCHQHLKTITNHPHSINDKYNINVMNYIIDTINNFKSVSKADIELSNDGVYFNNKTKEYFESSNILVRISVTKYKSTNNLERKALLINSHYD